MNQETISDIAEELEGVSAESEHSISKVMEWFLQVALAVLFVFIMAAALFDVRYKKRLKIYEETPKGEAIIDRQIQKLLVALEKQNAKARMRLGLGVLKSSDIISADKIVNSRFKDCCDYARKNLEDLKGTELQWYDEVIEEAKIEVLLTDEIKDWLEGEITDKINSLQRETLGLQSSVLRLLQAYYKEHPEAVSQECRKIAQEWYQAPAKRGKLLTKLLQEIDKQAKNVLNKAKVYLLNEVWDRQK